MIVAKELTKVYGSRAAVDHISFQVPRGQVVGFLGPNGAGKSTTLKMLSGFLPPTSGQCTVAGYDIVEESLEARQSIGYMPEAVPLYPELRVEEYLAFRAELKGVARKQRRDAVQKAMELADVADVHRRLIGELSKGYKQRVGLADALVASPPLLVLDEPTAGLDPNQILHVRELIHSLGKEHTIFLSTHILPEVEAVCSSVVIIARGRIVAEGTSEKIRAQLSGKGQDATLLVRGKDSAIRKTIEGIDGVSVANDPTCLDAQEDKSTWRFALTLQSEKRSSEDIAEELIAALVRAGHGVRGFEQHSASLETVFHELTVREETSAEEKPAKENAS